MKDSRPDPPPPRVAPYGVRQRRAFLRGYMRTYVRSGGNHERAVLSGHEAAREADRQAPRGRGTLRQER